MQTNMKLLFSQQVLNIKNYSIFAQTHVLLNLKNKRRKWKLIWTQSICSCCNKGSLYVGVLLSTRGLFFFFFGRHLCNRRSWCCCFTCPAYDASLLYFFFLFFLTRNHYYTQIIGKAIGENKNVCWFSDFSFSLIV